MIRRPAGSRRATALLLRPLAAVLLAGVLATGCGPGGDDGAAAPPVGSMTEEDYIAHVAALTVAVEEGLTGEAASARAVELGGGGHSREDVELFAASLRTRADRWVEIEKEVDKRAAELRGPPAGP